MELQKTKDWIDLALKVMSIIAILAAGAWAYYQFWKSETDATNIQMSVTTEVLKYSDNNMLLLIHLRPKNIGKVLVALKHLTVTVRDLPGDLKPGAVDLDKLKVLYRADVLDKYKDGYDMEPGIEYDELATIIVPKGMYSVSGEIDFDEDYEVDHTTIARVE